MIEIITLYDHNYEFFEGQQMRPQHIEDLIALTATMRDQSIVEYSKPLNFFLEYTSSPKNLLDPFMLNIVREIEAHELETKTRKNKRPHDVRKRFISAVSILILNLMQMRELIGDNLFLAVSLDRNTYSLKHSKRYAPPNMTYEAFVDAYAGLERTGYLYIKHKGYFDQNEGSGLCTRIGSTEKPLQAFDAFISGHDFKFARPTKAHPKDETIILKDNDKKKAEYTDTAYTRKARRNLKKINDVLGGHTYTLDVHDPAKIKDMKDHIEKDYFENPDGSTGPYIDFESIKLYRVFNENRFDRGGRFYRGWWQNVPSKYRKHILIDNEPTAELDYSRFHITMMYADLGVPIEGDAYDIHPKVDREISKKTINALISSRDITKQHKNFDPEITGMNWKDYIDLIKLKHKPLVDAEFLMSGYGLTLQYQDSELAEAILLHFTNQDIPCLPIHDSFIIQARYEDELRHIMGLVFKNRYNTDIKITKK